MEHFRRWGLAERIREVAPLKVDWSQDVVFCTTLLGHEVMRFTNCLGLSPQRTDLFAESGQQIAQPLVEEVLREAVTDLESCHLCLGWSLHTLQQHDDGVQATIVNEQGEQRQIRASYVLGCDGSRSVVRAAIGAHYVGTSDSRPNFGIVFRAPGLAERQPHGPAVHYWVLNPACPGVLGRMDLEDLWWAHRQRRACRDRPGQSARPDLVASSGPRSTPRCWEPTPGRRACCWRTATGAVGSSWLAMPRT